MILLTFLAAIGAASLVFSAFWVIAGLWHDRMTGLAEASDPMQGPLDDRPLAERLKRSRLNATRARLRLVPPADERRMG